MEYPNSFFSLIDETKSPDFVLHLDNVGCNITITSEDNFSRTVLILLSMLVVVLMLVSARPHVHELIMSMMHLDF